MKSIKAVSYPIHFEEKAYEKLASFIASKNYSSIFILVDTNTKLLCYPRFIEHLAIEKSIEVIEIKAGETYKNIDTCVDVWNALTELNADRHSLLITLGGGVVTDLGGFVASCFKRGIDFINIPTTLLSMVDASVGGKTGVDLGVLKNQIGLFANPQMVIIDDVYLQTLSPREIRSGIAEIIKYGLTYDIELFNQIKDYKNIKINNLIHKSIIIKNEVVLKDPKESGLRKILNFGHTIGHAIESYFLKTPHKEALTHGEAIAIGMVCESYISSKLLNLSKEKVEEVKDTIINIYGKVPILEEDFKPIIDLLIHDKKNLGGQVNFVLLNDFEDFKLDCKVSNELVIDSLKYY
ncbi:3-dehydroquinate synthase [Tenacibaculum sp. UWU-22]|uniref:3-dehydroquinate synthase n=1 Tax=Tenacibaculum sp. UWU-22 TaxID=3234187 RepID=UPI0034DB4C17